MQIAFGDLPPRPRYFPGQFMEFVVNDMALRRSFIQGLGLSTSE
jgi:hypothetical protein